MSYFSEYNRWDEGGGTKVFCIFATQEDTSISYHVARYHPILCNKKTSKLYLHTCTSYTHAPGEGRIYRKDEERKRQGHRELNGSKSEVHDKRVPKNVV
jgi:hypothetical protein